MVPRAPRYNRRMGGEHRGGSPATSEPRRFRGSPGRGRGAAAALAGRRVAESFPLAAEPTHWETLSRTPDRPLQRLVRLRARHAPSEGAAGATRMYVESGIYWLGWGSTTGRSFGCRERSRRRRSQPRRVEAGMLLRRLQEGDRLGMPHSRPMPGVGPRCHELRVVDAGKTWRIVCRLDPDAVVMADVFQKTTQQTSVRVIQDCRRRLAQYDAATGGD